MNSNKKIYFVSDFHLGTPSYEKSRERESLIIKWLDEIKEDASEIYFLGDVFDFWFEYKTVVPKGYIRFLGKLAELSDLGIEIILFKGNHDMWMFDYFVKEFNAKIIDNELIIERNGKKIFLHHGDGLGPEDHFYKFLKRFFRSPLCQFLFSWLHPDVAIRIADFWSKSSRAKNDNKEVFLGNEKEWLVIFDKEKLKQEHFDFFVHGHRHLPLQIELSSNSKYINLGEWLHSNTYAVFDGEDILLKYFDK